MNCDFVDKHLDAVLDGEVDVGGQLAIDQHVADCARCAEQLEFARAVQVHLKRSAQVSAPEGLRSRLAVELDRVEGGPVRVSTSWRSTLGVAAAALMVFGVGGVLQLQDGGPAQAGTVPMVDDLVRAHNGAAVTHVSAEQVPDYFARKVGFTVDPVRFQDPGVRFEGARFVHVAGRRAATLRYNVRGRRLTVVAFRTPHRPLEGVSVEQREGRAVRLIHRGDHTVPLVEHDGITYAVIGDMDPEDRLHILASAGL